MHYYKFNIGDYSSHTQHLDPIEDIAYRRMLDWYYLHESPLPDCIEQIGRLIRMRTHSESIASVLHEFFELTEYGWRQSKADKEINAYQEKIEKAKASAAARWEKPHANALRAECEGNANHKPRTNNHKPITNNILTSSEDDYSAPAVEKIPYQKIVDIYHKHCIDLPKVMTLTEARKRQVKARWNESTDQQELEFWEFYFTCVARSDFLSGRSTKFKADFQWLTKQENFIKVMEGKYV